MNLVVYCLHFLQPKENHFGDPRDRQKHRVWLLEGKMEFCKLTNMYM